MRTLIYLACLLPLTGCANAAIGPGGSAGGHAAAPAVPPAPANGGLCKADGLAAFNGRKATTKLAAEMLRLSGARMMRWGGPDMAMTMDFRQDRLTIAYDEKMIVTGARCG